jgi:hypothetical protein
LNLFNHIFVPGKGTRTKFRPVSSGGDRPRRLRTEHGGRIREQLARATTDGMEWYAQRAAWLKQHDWTGVVYSNAGFYLEIIASKFDPQFFESVSEGIQVVAAMPIESESKQTKVTLFIPAEAHKFFQERIDQYLSEDRDNKDGPAYADTIDRIDEVIFDDPIALLWTDAKRAIPDNEAWWEIWVRDECNEQFLYAIRRLGLEHKKDYLRFPERQVHYVFAQREDIAKVVRITSSVAELRRAADTPVAILSKPNAEQADLSSELLARTTPPGVDAPAVCVLDSGVNVGHPLLAVASSIGEAWTYHPDWGTHDGALHGHGTPVAGLALYGDLMKLLVTQEPVTLTHRIESVKVTPDDNIDPPDIAVYGLVYRDSMLIPQTHFPSRPRVFCTATTDIEECDRGIPTSWSGELDAMCADYQQRRLLVISAGNVSGNGALYTAQYPHLNELKGICDPAQAWNALTVGAYTDMQTISDTRFQGYQPLAPAGDIGPESRTTLLWERQWPIKPDVVFEGGNFAHEPGAAIARSIPDLSLVSTHSDPQEAIFTDFGCTSGAAALAAQTCATIMAKYPELWPETIRALVAHSAEYTAAMLGYYDRDDEQRRRNFVARFGHGVPNLQRALYSLQNDLTMVVQSTTQPFVETDSRATNNEIIYYDLPWPTEVLSSNFDAPVKLKVTLSYFVEPNPSRRGFSGRYSYASHGLRFAVRRPLESRKDFQQRVNMLERSEGFEAGGEDRWFLKRNVRDRGCLISDSWEGTAAELNDRSTIAIFPIGGWWKSLKGRSQANRSTRFALCVSLSVGDPAIDLYTPIKITLENTLETS